MKKAIVFLCTVIGALIVCAIFAYKVKNPIVPGIPPEGCESFSYNGRSYSSDTIYIADDDKVYMGVTKERRSSVYFVGDEKDPDIVVVCGSDNTGIYKADDYDIKVSGQITKVLVDPGIRDSGGITLQKQDDIHMLEKLMSVKGDKATYEINNFYTEGNIFYLEFDGCPAAGAENEGGYIAKSGNHWIYVSPENLDGMKQLDNANGVSVPGVEVTDDEIIRWIESSGISEWIK